MTVQIKDEVAVDHGYFWQPMASCPRGVKVQLLSPHGIAIYGQFNGKDEWDGWAPLPKRRKPNAGPTSSRS